MNNELQRQKDQWIKTNYIITHRFKCSHTSRIYRDVRQQRGLECSGDRILWKYKDCFIPIEMFNDPTFDPWRHIDDYWLPYRLRYDFEFWLFWNVRLRTANSDIKYGFLLTNAQLKMVHILESARRSGRSLDLPRLRVGRMGGETIVRLHEIWLRTQGQRRITIDCPVFDTPLYDDTPVPTVTLPTQLLYCQGLLEVSATTSLSAVNHTSDSGTTAVSGNISEQVVSHVVSPAVPSATDMRSVIEDVSRYYPMTLRHSPPFRPPPSCIIMAVCLIGMQFLCMFVSELLRLHMKAIYVDNNGAPVAMSPDSAVTPNRRPWFVPDFGGEWHARFLLAARIGRLGKGIAPEFADRYVDGFTVAVHPQPSDAAVPVSVSNFMDGALILGDWGPIGSMPFRSGDNSCLEIDFGTVAEAVSVCSRHITLKTGDVILIPVKSVPQLLVPNTRLEAFDSHNVQILFANIK